MALVQKQFSDLITFTRSSAGGRFNERGLFEMVPANQPRFDYDPITRQPRGILVEEARTNLITSSNEIGAAGWATNASSEIAKGVIASPDGLMNGAKISGTTEFYVYRIVPITGRPTLTISVYAKQVKPGDAIRLRLFEGGGTQSNETQTSPSITLTDQWVRYEFTATVKQSDRTSVQLILLGNIAQTGSEAYFWGAQMEVGAFATSLIKTEASQVTRAGDAASVNNLSPWYNQAEGTMFIDYVPGAIGSGSTCVGFYMSSENPAFDIVTIRNGTTPGTITGILVNSTGGRLDMVGATGIPVGVRVKGALAYKAGDGALSVNAGKAVVTTPTGIPTPTRFGIGRATSAQQYANGHVREIRYYPRRLTNAELEALTT